MIAHSTAESWMTELKEAWEARDVERALALFSVTREYYERPFRAGTTQEEYRKYWEDIVGLEDVRLDYEVVAVEGQTACVHWENRFRTSDGGAHRLDGVFAIEFDEEGRCVVFRQWWFAE